MRTGTACGRVIADGWCESHGHAHALAFGLGSDVTGTVNAGGLGKVEPRAMMIRCGD